MILQGDPYNLQGSSPPLQGGATAAVLQPAVSPQPPTANPQPAALGIAPRGPAASFYKPNPNSQQVFNTQGQALSYDQFIAQGGKADFSNVLNSAFPGMAPAAPVSAPAPKPTPAPQPAPAPMGMPTAMPAASPAASAPTQGGNTFYKPDPNSQQVYNAQGQPVSYEQFIAQGGKPDFSNVVAGTAPGAAQAQPGAATPTQGAQPLPTTPPASATNPTQTRIDQLSKDIFQVAVPSQQKLYEDAYNAAGLATVRTTLENLNKRIAAKQEAYTAKEGDINENPFLSEASRIGRLRRLDEQKQAEIGNLLDQYKQYADLYNTGVNEVNDSVTRQIGDFNTTRQIGTEELNFLLGISDKEYDRKKDEQAVQRETETDARTFALKNNITQPFYTIDGRTIIRTSDGKAYSTEAEWLADGGKPDLVQKVQAQDDLNLKDYPNSYQEYLLAKQDGFAGSYTEYQDADANRKERVASAGVARIGGLTPGQVNSTVNQIAGALDNEPIVKQYNTVAEQVGFVRSLGTSPTDDQARIYAFAKVMDPNSAVREGEYKTVQQYATALLQRFGLNAKRVFTNSGILTDEARGFLLNTLNQRLNSVKPQYDNLRNEYQRQIDDAMAGKPRTITEYTVPNATGGAPAVSLDDLF